MDSMIHRYGAADKPGASIKKRPRRAMPDLSLLYPYSAVNGKSAMLRARLMATVTWR